MILIVLACALWALILLLIQSVCLLGSKIISVFFSPLFFFFPLFFPPVFFFFFFPLFFSFPFSYQHKILTFFHSFIQPPDISQKLRLKGDGELTSQHDHVFWCGDLNFRIDMDRDKALQLIAKKRLFNFYFIFRLFWVLLKESFGSGVAEFLTFCLFFFFFFFFFFFLFLFFSLEYGALIENDQLISVMKQVISLTQKKQNYLLYIFHRIIKELFFNLLPLRENVSMVLVKVPYISLPLIDTIGFVLFCFVLFCFVLFCFVLFCFVLFCFVLFCFVLFCFVLFCFVLFCFVLFCFVLLAFPDIFIFFFLFSHTIGEIEHTQRKKCVFLLIVIECYGFVVGCVFFV